MMIRQSTLFTQSADLPPGPDSDRSRLRVGPTCRAERKFVTVLFADLTGSMALSRLIELEQWWRLTGALYERMCESVYRFGGWIGNFTGDGVNAIFEADGSPEDHARRACEAALWLRDGMQRPVSAAEHELKLTLRIGLNSGEVFTGTIGDQQNRCYTANGYAVALAKRMESLAPPGQIYMTDHTAALASRGIELRHLGPFDVKGASIPVDVYELVRKAGPR
jgi:class 3 adenylate cyclase